MLTIRIAKREILDVLLVVGLLSLPLLSADKPKDAVPPAPVPSPIAAAKKVFISNAPGSSLPASFGGPDRTYNEFYAAMKGWGPYELVAAPSDADLILEISFTSSLSGSWRHQYFGTYFLQLLRTQIGDPRCQDACPFVVVQRRGQPEDIVWKSIPKRQ